MSIGVRTVSIQDSLPPVAQILSSERITDKTFDEARSYFLELLPELRAQAEWTQVNHVYIDSGEFNPGTSFIATPVSGMNPFSHYGKCSDPNCRIKNANRFAQTLGLYSDKINIHDPFTMKFLDDEEWSDDEIATLLYDTIVLQELMPLFNNGVINFLNPSVGYCRSCYKKFSRHVNHLAENILKDFQSEFEVTRFDDGFSIETGMLHEPPLTHFIPITDAKRMKSLSKKGIQNFQINSIADEIKEILMNCNSAPVQNSAIFSNSRVALHALRNLEGRETPRQIEAWELAHSADLPWIKDLSVQQIVHLREEASDALPQLREQLAINVSSKNANELNSSEDKSMELVRELRASAAEVSAELNSINIQNERSFHNVAGTLGLTVAIYGFGADLMAPAMALGTLLSTLGLIHAASKKDEQDVKRITSKPGYVFVKAKDLLSHAD